MPFFHASLLPSPSFQKLSPSQPALDIAYRVCRKIDIQRLTFPITFKSSSKPSYIRTPDSFVPLIMPIAPPLSTGFGYGIVLGLGFAFALGMITTTYVLKRYNSEVQTSEMFSTAGRTVKSGLVASAVVSSWTWAATLLQSSGVAYRYGVSGPFWYASGATVQILLFATLAIELKRKAPNAHTFLEVIRARYGVYAHLVFTVFGLMTNILVYRDICA